MVTMDLTAVIIEQLHSTYKDCPVLQHVLKHQRSGWPRVAKGLDPALLHFYRIQNELAELAEVLVRRPHRVVIPFVLRQRLIQLAHGMRQGIVMTE